MANPMYGQNKNDEALEAIANAIEDGVITDANAAGTHALTITINGVAWKILLVAG